MPDCIICGGYTKFPNGKCYNCYKVDNNPVLVEGESDEMLEWQGGLSEREWNSRYNMIKGRIAETLIQELFLSLGYNVFRYGMENTISGVMELLKGINSDVALQIRRMPDFVVQHPASKEVFFIEVKFRASGTFTKKDIASNYPYNNAYIILVSKRHIKCLSIAELRDGKEITPDSHNYLGNRKEFELNKDVIIQFCQFAVQFFEKV